MNDPLKSREGGFVKIFRSTLDWEWFQKPEMVQLWIYLLLKTNHQDKKWQGMTIKRGQLFIGRQKIQAETKLSEQTIKTCLKRLKSTGEITTKSTSKGTLITIVNWEDFQVYDEESNQQSSQQINQQLTSNQPTANQRLTTNKNVKNDKNEKNSICGGQKRSSTALKFSKPSFEEVKEYAESIGFDIDARRFIDYYEANGWKVGRNQMKDWKATVRNWKRQQHGIDNTRRVAKMPGVAEDVSVWEEFLHD